MTQKKTIKYKITKKSNQTINIEYYGEKYNCFYI